MIVRFAHDHHHDIKNQNIIFYLIYILNIAMVFPKSNLTFKFSIDGVLSLVVAGAFMAVVTGATRVAIKYLDIKKEMFLCDRKHSPKKIQVNHACKCECSCGGCKCATQESFSDVGFQIIDDHVEQAARTKF